MHSAQAACGRTGERRRMIQSMRAVLFAAAAGGALALSACGETTQSAPEVATSTVPVFHAEGRPEKLSEWNLLRVADGGLALNDRVTPYDLNSALFTDYAHKLRTVWLPAGASGEVRRRRDV